MSALSELFKRANRTLPSALAEWENRVDGWCDGYNAKFPHANLSEINLDLAVFMFDHVSERVILAYALSIEQLTKRDSSRMRGFPDVNVSVRKVVGENAFNADKGHFLGHASGGILDINLFPQRRELNRGWSPEGKRFRKMERYVAEHPGKFFYHRAIYNDETWIPYCLEYGVLCGDTRWWVDTFRNK
jgi:hypothetical protein